MDSAGGELDLMKSTDSSVDSRELDLTKSSDSMDSSVDSRELDLTKSSESMDSSGDSSGGGDGGEVDMRRLRLYDLFKDEGEESNYESSDEELYYELDSNGVSIDWKEDPDFYADDANGYHEMYPEEQEEYCNRVIQSDGFDVPYFPKALAIGIIVPVSLYANKAVYCEILCCAEYALEQHNLEMKKNYELYKIVKANVCGVAGSIYYITFQAEDLDKAVQTQNVDQEAADLVPKNVGPAGGPIVEFEAEVFLLLPDEQRICKMEVINFRQKGSKVTRMIKGCCG